MRLGRSVKRGPARVRRIAAIAALGAVAIVPILGAGSSPVRAPATIRTDTQAAAQAGAGAAPAFRGEVQAFLSHAEPQPLPEIAFQGPEGERRTLADWRERVVLLNFWAVWCAPCLKEMPALDRLQAKLGQERFEVVAISIDRGDGAGPRAFFERLELRHLRLYRDPTNQSSRALKLRGLPTTLLIDHQGRELGRLEGGADWDSAEAEALIRHYLPAAAPPRHEGRRR